MPQLKFDPQSGQNWGTAEMGVSGVAQFERLIWSWSLPRWVVWRLIQGVLEYTGQEPNGKLGVWSETPRRAQTRRAPEDFPVEDILGQEISQELGEHLLAQMRENWISLLQKKRAEQWPPQAGKSEKVWMTGAKIQLASRVNSCDHSPGE